MSRRLGQTVPAPAFSWAPVRLGVADRAMRAALDWIFRRFIVTGTVDVTWPDGTCRRYGSGAMPRAGMRLATAHALWQMLVDPAMALGELYMSGELVAVDGGIHELIDVLGANRAGSASAAYPSLRLAELVGRARRRLDQYNTAARARLNVAHHYDISNDLYALFLDADMQYSCAYFATGTETLDAAQAAKKRHIAAKLALDRPGLRVLDIGCGWGGMALTLARDFGCEVTGITLSRAQLEHAEQRAEAAGLAGQVRFVLMDYRDAPALLDGPFDRVVSVGMFEHVGLVHYRGYFEAVKRCLAPDGVALVHSIGRSEGPESTNRWFAKYIFPGGYSPALSEMAPAVEQSGLIVTDVEVLRLHYARTIACWRERFAARRDVIAAMYDERFCRMFEFYFAGAEMAFRRQGHVVFQLQLTRGVDALPTTRGYMEAAERVAAGSVRVETGEQGGDEHQGGSQGAAEADEQQHAHAGSAGMVG